MANERINIDRTAHGTPFDGFPPFGGGGVPPLGGGAGPVAGPGRKQPGAEEIERQLESLEEKLRGAGKPDDDESQGAGASGAGAKGIEKLLGQIVESLKKIVDKLEQSIGKNDDDGDGDEKPESKPGESKPADQAIPELVLPQ
jgi:hypothetical protein